MSISVTIRTQPLLVGLSLIPPLIALVFIVTYAYNLPFWDEWALVPLLQKAYSPAGFAVGDLAVLHNEHRLVFPKLIMLGLACLTSWNIKYELYVGYACLVACFAYLWHAITKTYEDICGRHTKELYCAGLLASVLMFSTNQYENLLWGWQIALFLNVLCVVAGFYYLTNGEQLKFGNLALALLLGTVATYSFANGLLFWIIGALILIVRKPATPNFYMKLAAWVFYSAVIFYTYLATFSKPATADSHSPGVVRHLFDVTLYVLLFIGSPVVKPGLVTQTRIPIILCGIGALLVIVALLYVLFRGRLLSNKRIVFWNGLLLYSVFSAGITALGRTQFGLQTATSSRYVTICNFLWIWILVLGSLVVARHNKVGKKVWIVVCTIFTGFFLWYDVLNFSAARQQYALKQAIQVALAKGDYDTKLMPVIYPTPEPVKPWNEFLRKNKLTFYAE